ncbi:MAG TPA: hypothetical protein VG324_18080, partial [Blastocatellia bacterium]|nr:hypothetical protein [Blastocatellia bacterium]
MTIHTASGVTSDTNAMWMQCEIFRAITMPGSKGLRIADCGLRIADLCGFQSPFHGRVKQAHKSAI